MNITETEYRTSLDNYWKHEVSPDVVMHSSVVYESLPNRNVDAEKE